MDDETFETFTRWARNETHLCDAEYVLEKVVSSDDLESGGIVPDEVHAEVGRALASISRAKEIMRSSRPSRVP